MKIEDKINAVLEKIRPFLINDGGDAKLIKYKDGIAYIKMLGSCSNCLYSGITIQDTIETILTSEIPEVLEVKEYIEGLN